METIKAVLVFFFSSQDKKDKWKKENLKEM